MSEVKIEKVSIRRIMEIIHDPQNMLEHGRRDYWYNQIHLILEKAFAEQRTTLLTKLRDEVLQNCAKREHSRRYTAIVNVKGLKTGRYVPEICGYCLEVLALLEKAGA